MSQSDRAQHLPDLPGDTSLDWNPELTIHTTRQSIHALSDIWEDLARRSDQSIYMTSEWILAWWDHFGEHPDRCLFILSVKSGDRIVAILPFYQGVSRFGSRTIEKRLQLIGSGGHPDERFGFMDDYGISDFLDILVHPDFNKPVAEYLVSLFDSAAFSEYRITFHQARQDSYVASWLLPALDSSDRDVQVTDSDTCPVIDLSGENSLDAYIKSQRSSARRRLRQAMNGPESTPDYRVESPDSESGLSIMLEELVRLHQHRWNQLGFPGVFHDPRFKSFFLEITSQLYRQKSLWIQQAGDDHGTAAIRMAMYYNHRYYDYMSGFEADHPSARLRPGIGLLLNLVHDAQSQGVSRIELLRGEEPYKYDFTQKTIKNFRISLPPRRSESLFDRLSVTLLYSTAWGLTRLQKEWRLLQVQRRNNGLFGMIQGYLTFRWHSLKDKWNSEASS